MNWIIEMKKIYHKSKDYINDKIKHLKIYQKVFLWLGVIFVITYSLDYINFFTRANLPSNHEWLSFVGSLIGAWATIYGIAVTLKFEREQFEKSSKNAVRPVFNASGDIFTFKYENKKEQYSYLIFEEDKYKHDEDRTEPPRNKFTINNYIGIYHDYEGILEDGTEMEKNCIDNLMKTSPTICIKIRNISQSHAIINEFNVIDSENSSFSYQLRPDERFTIDAGKSNIILIKLPTSDYEKIQIFFQDVLETHYVYQMRIEYRQDLSNELIAVNVLDDKPGNDKYIKHFRVASKVYFEEYFPKECQLNERN